MIRSLLEKVRGLQDLSSWTVRWVDEEQWQRSYYGHRCECRRRVREQYADARLSVTRERQGAVIMGTGRCRLEADLPETGVTRRLRDAMAHAAVLEGTYWPLPKAIHPPAVDIHDEASATHPEESLDTAAALLFDSLQEEDSVGLSHMELSLTARRVHFVSSTELDASYKETMFTLYAVLLGRGNGDRLDVKLERHRRAPGDLDIPAMIARASAQARDSLRARLPRGGSMPVVMESDALEYVFDPFITHAGGALQYRGLSRFHPGEPVIPARRGEPIFLASDGLLVHGNNSLPFDEDGVPAHRIAVVEDGRFLSPVCDQEHSQYLGVRATGPFANKVLGSGPRSLSELVGDGGPLLHVVAFSSCIPDNLTGDFVGEIRLAYEHRDGAVIPVKGGAVSGNVFNAFADAHFSAEREFRGDYLGPRAVRLGPLTVVGV